MGLSQISAAYGWLVLNRKWTRKRHTAASRNWAQGSGVGHFALDLPMSRNLHSWRLPPYSQGDLSWSLAFHIILACQAGFHTHTTRLDWSLHIHLRRHVFLHQWCNWARTCTVFLWDFHPYILSTIFTVSSFFSCNPHSRWGRNGFFQELYSVAGCCNAKYFGLSHGSYEELRVITFAEDLFIIYWFWLIHLVHFWTGRCG